MEGVDEKLEILSKVSVITVVYNAEKVLENAILSVLNQTYPNIEYVVVDGKSTDSTVDILKKYGDRIIWRSEPDDGIFDAMNKGLKMSGGEWIHFLGADDTLESDGIQNLINFSESADIVYGNTHLIFENGMVRNQLSHSVDLLDKKMIASHQSFIVRRSVFDKIGLFNTNYKLTSDYDFLIRAYLFGIKFKKTDVFVVNYNIYGESSNVIKSALEIYKIQRKYGFKHRGYFGFLKSLGKGYFVKFFKLLFKDSLYLKVILYKYNIYRWLFNRA